LLELRGAITRVHEMRMAIDEAGRDEPAFAVDDLVGGEPGAHRALVADVDDEAVARGERPVLDYSETGTVQPGIDECCEAGVSPEAVTAHAGTIYTSARGR
jgi:hypothetical protein